MLTPRAAVDTFLARLSGTDTLCAAVSGGGDSMALLFLLYQGLRGRTRPRLTAVTVDHRLSSGSADVAAGVGTFCRSLGIDHRVMTWEADKPATGLQAAARLTRHDLLRRAAGSFGAGAVVTAHTCDDQLETVRMRWRRGPGPGLAGIPRAMLFRRDCWILRPLLGVRREALRDVLRQAGIAWFDDPANGDRRFERARERARSHDLAEDEALLALAARTAAERREANRRLAACLRERVVIHAGMIAEVSGGSSAGLSGAALLLSALMGGRARLPAGRAHVERFVNGCGPVRLTLARALLERRDGGIFIHREFRSLPVLTIPPGEEAVWDGRYRIVNRSADRPLTVGPAARPAGTLPPAALPRAMMSRAWRAQPSVLADPPAPLSGLPASANGVSVTRHFPCFDLFLTDFDCIVANAVAALFAAPPWPPPPIPPPGRHDGESFSMNGARPWQDAPVRLC